MLARKLRRALLAAQAADSMPVTTSLTHGVHSYPARIHPATARHLLDMALERISDEARSSAAVTVLDPFCGSGTVLVEAHRAGVTAAGVDASPLAVRLAWAKTWIAPKEKRERMRALGREIASATIAEGRAARRASYESQPEWVPKGADARIRNERLKPWFSAHVRRELEHLARAIDDARAEDLEIANALEMALSAILYKVSLRASDTDNRPIVRKIARGAAARLFRDRVEQLCDGLSTLAQSANPKPHDIALGDARNIAHIADSSVAIAITSPPYAGTYDYQDHQSLRIDFLGLPGSEFERNEMGARRWFEGDADQRRRARRRYRRALAATMKELDRVLVPRGVAIIMLGDSLAGDRAIWADEALAEAASERFELNAAVRQERPILGSRERSAFGEHGKWEYIYWLSKLS